MSCNRILPAGENVPGVEVDWWNRDYLALRFDKNEYILAAVRDIPGREFVSSMRHWRVPVGSAAHMLALFNTRKIVYQLTDKAVLFLKTYRDVRQTLIDIKMRQPEGEVQIAGMEYPLRAYQANGVDFLTSGRRVLLADDMGLGKTVQALAQIKLLKPRNTLIICMNSLKYNWMNEIRKHTPSIPAIVVEGSKTRRKAIWDSTYPVKITNYQLLQHDEDIMPHNWDNIIADEATAIKTHGTITSRNIKKLRSTYAVAMSGTPMENHLMEMHSILEFVRPGLLGSRWDFRNRYINYGFNGTIAGYKNVQDFHERVTPFMLRRRKRDVLQELPDKIYERVDIELTQEERRLYAKWRSLVVREIDSIGNVTNLWTQNALTRMLRLKQIVDHPLLLEDKYEASVAKMSALEDIISDTDQKVVIFTQFTQMARILARKYNAEIIQGEVNPQERLNIIERFQNNGQQVLVSTDAGAYGLTITAASVVVHYDLTWNPAKQAQREDRLHRIGQKNPVTVVNLIAKETIDEYILDTLFRKMQAFELIVEQADEALMQRITRADIDNMLQMSPA